MAEAKIQYNISLDDESKDLIRQLVKAVDRIADAQAPETDVSFGDHGKRRMVEDALVNITLDERSIKAAVQRGERIYNAQDTREIGRKFLDRVLPEGEGDHLLHDDEHEGEDLE